MYSEKTTKFCEISTLDLSYVVMVKSTVEISQDFVAFSEYMNFNRDLRVTKYMPRYLEMIDFDLTFIRLVKNFEWKLTFKLFSFAV